MAGAIPVVKGYAVRATKIDACGKPIEGPKNRIVTDGFIEAVLEPEMKNREELEQLNAEGKVCFSDSTPPEVKRYNPRIQFCGVDPDLYSLFNSNIEKVLDYDDTAIGIADSREIDTKFGVAIEIWTGGQSEDDCEDNPTDALFSVQGSGIKYGYLLFGGKEWVPGNFSVTAGVSTFDLSGITIPIPHWGRGPYNVARINANGDAGRLLAPVSKTRNFTFFRTPIAPPEPTDGAVPLDITGKFVDPDFYFGGPANEPAADVAPEQAAVDQGYNLTITGTPTGGTFSLTVEYPDQADLETGTIAYNATAANVKTALVPLDDGYDANDWTTSGTTLPGGTVLIVPPPGVVVTVEDNNLTGGTTPAVHVDEA